MRTTPKQLYIVTTMMLWLSSSSRVRRGHPLVLLLVVLILQLASLTTPTIAFPVVAPYPARNYFWRDGSTSCRISTMKGGGVTSTSNKKSRHRQWMMSHRHTETSFLFTTTTTTRTKQQRRNTSFVLWEKPSWLQEAMGNSDNSKDDDDNKDRLSNILPLASGLSGFAVDPQRGFCAILSEPPTTTTTTTSKSEVDANNTINDAESSSTSSSSPIPKQQQQQRCLYVVVSPQDKSQLQSPEALTLVQLAGGLDLGTPIVPPDILAKLVSEQLQEDYDSSMEELSSSLPLSSEDLRKRLTLLRVEAVPIIPTSTSTISSNPENTKENDDQDKDTTTTTTTTKTTTTTTTNNKNQEERTKAILIAIPRVLSAVKGLPGLSDTTPDQLEQAMEYHADDNGNLDRIGFSQVLDELRRGGGNIGNGGETYQPAIQLMLWVVIDPIINREDPTTTPTPTTPSILQVEAPSILLGLALAMRYKVPITVDETCFYKLQEEEEEVSSHWFTSTTILDQFPAFRPIRELYEDAKVMDGFIPSMVQKAKDLDNDDKV